MFQPWTVTPPKPRLCCLLLYSLLLESSPPPPPDFGCPYGGGTTFSPPPPPPTSTLLSHGIIRPPGRHPSPSQYTKNTSPLPNHLLSESNSSSPPSPLPHLMDSCCYHSLAAAKISSNVHLSCFSAATCCHHISWSFPPPS